MNKATTLVICVSGYGSMYHQTTCILYELYVKCAPSRECQQKETYWGHNSKYNMHP